MKSSVCFLHFLLHSVLFLHFPSSSVRVSSSCGMRLCCCGVASASSRSPSVVGKITKPI